MHSIWFNRICSTASRGPGACSHTRLFALILIAGQLIGTSAARTDQMYYYVSVSCDPARERISIALGELWNTEFTLAWHGQFEPSDDSVEPQKFNVSGAIGYGECYLAPGRLARVRVTESPPMAYGICGGDPNIWLSVWVDQRRWVSRLKVAGRCAEHPVSHVEIFSDRLTICTERQSFHSRFDERALRENCQTEPASALSSEPDKAQFRGPKPGSIQIEYGDREPLCHRSISTTTNEFGRKMWRVAPPEGVQLLTSNDLQHGDFQGSGHFSRSTFDIDNSGNVRTIYGFHPSMHPNDADMYFATPGAAVDGAWPRISPDMLYRGSPYIFPYSFGQCRDHLCGPDDADEDGIVKFVNYEIGGEPLAFRFRYLHETPFQWRGATYFFLTDLDWDKRFFFVILRPASDHFDEVCILRRIPED